MGTAGTDTDATTPTTAPDAVTRRRWPWLAALVALAVVVVAVVLVVTGGDGADGPASDAPTFATAEVVRTDLVDETEFDGTLGRPDAEAITAGRQGTVTEVPDVGTELVAGDTVMRIDDQPIVLLSGTTPAFRDLGYGSREVTLPAGRQGTITGILPEGAIVTEGAVIARIDEAPIVALDGTVPAYRTLSEGDEGPDVAQLEEALVALGYDPDGDVTIDDEFTNATEAMVERWQEDLGVEETGIVALGDVVFSPLPAQVLVVAADVAAVVSPTTPVMTVSGGEPLSGPDVAQLETGLVDLGHLDVADDVLDVATVAAIADFQAARGLEVDGVLALGEVVFRDGAIRTAEVLAPAGTTVTPTTPVVEATSSTTIVRVDLPASDQGAFTVGGAVVIELPDRTETPGTVTSVASVATTGPQGDAFFEVEIALDEPAAAGSLDEAPVDVAVVTDTAEDVLAVPVTALLALAEGGYAVEVVDPDGTTRLVAADPGFFAGGFVEIDADVEPGDLVVVP
ncbi:MAG: peptidoglycan-binding domain-containing protein [Acidimicrobiia bacterium]